MTMHFAPRLKPWTLSLLASAFLATAYNIPFWTSFVQATGRISLERLPLHLGSLLLVILIFNAALTLLNFRYVLKPALTVLFMTAAATSYFMAHYGIQVDRTMIQNLLETDMREARELCNLQLIGTLGLFGVLPAVLLWRSRIEYADWRHELGSKLAIVAGSLAVAAGLLFLLFKSLAPALHEHRELRYLLTPTNGIQAMHAYLKQHSAPSKVAPLGTDAVKAIPLAARRVRSVTVIVVGETARARNFSLNGYARETNPHLAQRTGLINFRHVSSCGTATAVSLPCVFSALGRDAYSDARAHGQEGLLDVLAHAGFNVLWRDNNSGCKGACDRISHEDLSAPEAGNRWCVGDECYDERLLDRLPEMIRTAQEDMVVVLHQKGSHGPAYSHRYPVGFGKFGPVCDTVDLSSCSRQAIVDAYDNTILYTDHFLDRTIALLKDSAERERVDTAMLYFSDHGESLGENNMYLHGAPYMLSPPEQREVPMMLWLSDGYVRDFRLDPACLAARAGQQFSHDNVFHSVLGLLRVRTAVYNPHLDIVGPCTHEA
jgi:lipid A ethanolaminephosphotransferase